jgi:hypothetical protein
MVEVEEFEGSGKVKLADKVSTRRTPNDEL